MSIAGELTINVSLANTQHAKQTPGKHIISQITSRRPLQAANLFKGKSISQTVTTLPLLFNICSKAQTVTALRAIESAMQSPASKQTESSREALIILENLREQTLRVVMDWPPYIKEQADNRLLSHVASGINQLMQSLDPGKILSINGITSKTLKQSQWESFRHTLSQAIFGSDADTWLNNMFKNGQHPQDQIANWASRQHTQAARFIDWLNQKEWKHAGKSSIAHIPNINDNDLLILLSHDEQTFTSKPSWNNDCYELSWFSRKHLHDDGKKTDNGIYTRMVARLKEIADLITQLDRFYIHEAVLKSGKISVTGMAHSEAARGRLTHYVEVEGNTINKLVILAPTEWNFHPNGVAVDSLNHLHAESIKELRQQAELLIHAIDPCVGYQLQISG